MFAPLTTSRLVVRPVVAEDLGALVERRNDPGVAALQGWALPFPLERARDIIESTRAMSGPEDEQWWMATIEETATGSVVGDLVVRARNNLRTLEVGYTLARERWGRGLAVEGLTALVDWLFDALPVTRIEGQLHPDNRASAMVLERTGFLFEGHTRLSFWLGDDNSDDWIYGLTRPDWEAWRSRPRTPPADVRLVPVTQANRSEVLALRTHRSQQAFVATMPQSFADALVPDIVDGAPVVPWIRAIEADGAIVGFVMLAITTPHHPEPYLWRLLIDRMHQRRGIGSRALELVADECRAMGDPTFLVSWSEGKGSPRDFYLAHGFEPTGRVVDGETEARRALRRWGRGARQQTAPPSRP